MFNYLLLSANYHDIHTRDKLLTVQCTQINFTINKHFPGIVYDKWNIADISINC